MLHIRTRRNILFHNTLQRPEYSKYNIIFIANAVQPNKTQYILSKIFAKTRVQQIQLHHLYNKCCISEHNAVYYFKSSCKKLGYSNCNLIIFIVNAAYPNKTQYIISQHLAKTRVQQSQLHHLYRSCYKFEQDAIYSFTTPCKDPSIANTTSSLY